MGVHPTHRRRGFLRQLISAMHADARERGEAIAGLEPINRLADASPGFVWRLQTAAGDATSIRPTEDDLAFAATASIIHSTYRSGLEDMLP